MPRVNDHVVGLHRILDFVDDGPAGSFNAEYLSDFDDMVG
jgi:hypothetical protein